MGQNNYRPFVLFLIYMWLACAYGVLLLWRPFFALVYGGGSGGRPHMPVIVGSLASVRAAARFCASLPSVVVSTRARASPYTYIHLL